MEPACVRRVQSEAMLEQIYNDTIDQYKLVFNFLGLPLPSVSYIVGSLLFTIIGIICFRHARKIKSKRLLYTSIAMLLYPNIIYDGYAVWMIGLALSGYYCYELSRVRSIQAK